MSNPFEQQKAIPGVKKIIAISSRKGGVGKSTFAANLAIALSKYGKVGILDADIYGPSQPRMFGALNQKPQITPEQKLLPIVRSGVSLMSIGFIVEEASAVVWRGPMLFKAMDQFLRDVVWDNLEYLLVDLPPGTGDIQLSLAQKVPISGAIVVSTPQNIALADVKKSIDMFKKVQVPIIGVIENMSYLVNDNQKRVQLFPKGDLKSFLDAEKLPYLGETAFQPKIALASEMGIPYVASQPDSLEGEMFSQIAAQIDSRGF